ncbi:MAG: hypothetical protein ACW99A_15415 [Candidatus Kariarchaeaceae archaeon]
MNKEPNPNKPIETFLIQRYNVLLAISGSCILVFRVGLEVRSNNFALGYMPDFDSSNFMISSTLLLFLLPLYILGFKLPNRENFAIKENLSNQVFLIILLMILVMIPPTSILLSLDVLAKVPPHLNFIYMLSFIFSSLAFTEFLFKEMRYLKTNYEW